MPRSPLSPGSTGWVDRPARQEKGRTMTEASVSFAGNVTDDPEVRYTESAIARAISGSLWQPGGSTRRRSSPWSSGATRPSRRLRRCPRPAAWRSWAGSSSGAGRGSPGATNNRSRAQSARLGGVARTSPGSPRARNGAAHSCVGTLVPVQLGFAPAGTLGDRISCRFSRPRHPRP
jgi:hypothetical protein